ncbi:MAG: hypothetical protein UU47_C0015G0023 [candidate division TM6 bacterium GW2011_GWE2_41_16]|nr:MAG: hypothetical protein UU47_C0015G0023 [candidate division TM6 bacterium GW2011_GWE2_41_16]
MKHLLLSILSLTLVLSPSMHSMEQAPQPQAPQPASTSQPASVEEKPLCSICIDEHSANDLAVLACGNNHIMCRGCVIKNLAILTSEAEERARRLGIAARPVQSFSCPFCRSQVKAPYYTNSNEALRFFILKENIDAIKKCLNMFDIDVCSHDLCGTSMLGLAVAFEAPDVVQLFLSLPQINPNTGSVEVNDDEMPLVRAAMNECIKNVKILLANERLNPNQRGKNSHTTALIAATGMNNPAIVKLLLADNKVNPFLRNKKGETALDVAKKGVTRISKHPFFNGQAQALICAQTIETMLINAMKQWTAVHPFDITEID